MSHCNHQDIIIFSNGLSFIWNSSLIVCLVFYLRNQGEANFLHLFFLSMFWNLLYIGAQEDCHLSAQLRFYLLHNTKMCSIFTHRKRKRWAKARVLHHYACACQVAHTSSPVVFTTVRGQGELQCEQDASTQSTNFTERFLKKEVLRSWIFRRIYHMDTQLLSGFPSWPKSSIFIQARRPYVFLDAWKHFTFGSLEFCGNSQHQHHSAGQCQHAWQELVVLTSPAQPAGTLPPECSRQEVWFLDESIEAFFPHS